jgi:hypothetical protein
MGVPKTLSLVVLLAGCGTVEKNAVDRHDRDIHESSLSVAECPVHKRPLVVAVEPYVASHISWGPERTSYLAEAKQKFPYAMADLTDRFSGKTHLRMHYCPDCRKAERGWHEAHDLKPEERDLLRLYAEGKTVEEAGAEIGLDPERARSLFVEVIARLQWFQGRATNPNTVR